MSRHDEDIAADLADWTGFDEDERDYWQEYKDGVAQGYINPDGSQREPGEPDFEAEAYDRHCQETHGGKACDCPPSETAWELPEGETYDTEAPF
jgi:hypothetical protein